MSTKKRLTRGGLVLVASSLLAISLDAQSNASEDSLQRAIFRELVEINTSPEGGPGSVSTASRAVVRRLTAGGYSATEARLLGPDSLCLNVVATLKGRNSTAKPVLLMAHLDVVPAHREDWTFDPFVLREESGWFYGRGTMDNKAGASVLVANMLRWKRENYVPDRDVVMILTCDEETSAEKGIQWLVANVPEIKKADYALNTDAGDVSQSSTGKVVFGVQAAEKVYASFTLEATNPGGHSSVPRDDNAIYALAGALTRLSQYHFPVSYNEVTRETFSRAAELESGQMAQDMRAAAAGDTSGPAIERLSRVPYIAANLRTTCVATMLSAGHAENALSQSAKATVNCRVFPGKSVGEVERKLVEIVGDTSISVRPVDPATPSPPSPLRSDIMPTLGLTVKEFWGADAVVIPAMSNGATDGLYVRNAGVPVYGVAGILIDPEKERSHGLDEGVPVPSLYQSREFWYKLVMRLTSPSRAI